MAKAVKEGVSFRAPAWPLLCRFCEGSCGHGCELWIEIGGSFLGYEMQHLKLVPSTMDGAQFTSSLLWSALRLIAVTFKEFVHLHLFFILLDVLHGPAMGHRSKKNKHSESCFLKQTRSS